MLLKKLETKGRRLVAVERHPVCARGGGAVPVFYDSQMQDAVAARMGKRKAKIKCMACAGSDMLLLCGQLCPLDVGL